MRLVWRFWCFSLLMLCHFCSKHDLCHWSVCLLRRNKLWFGVVVWHCWLSLSLPLFSLLPSNYHDIFLLVCFFFKTSFFYVLLHNCYVRFIAFFFLHWKLDFFCYNNHWIVYNLWIVHSNKKEIASYKSYEPTSNNWMNFGCIYLSQKLDWYLQNWETKFLRCDFSKRELCCGCRI